MDVDKDTLKEAIREMAQEEKIASEKIAAEVSDAFELGIHSFMKQAGINTPEDKEVFLGYCNLAAASVQDDGQG